MLPADVLKKIRRIQITTSRLVNESLAGEYHSVFKGRGMEFDEVREYQHGDDIRTIDWNVTSRTGHPYVKRYVEERELTVMLLVDASASGNFGSGEKSKMETAAEISALLAFSAIQNHDRVGAILFTDRVEKFIPPRRGSTHVLRVIREVLYHKPQRSGTSIELALEHLNRVLHKSAVVFLISDLLDQGFESALKTANRRHDVVVIRMVDPRERELPAVGIVEMRDAETDETIFVDTSIPSIRNAYRDNWERDSTRIQRFFRSQRIENIALDISRPYDLPLVRFFSERARRMR